MIRGRHVPTREASKVQSQVIHRCCHDSAFLPLPGHTYNKTITLSMAWVRFGWDEFGLRKCAVSYFLLLLSYYMISN